MRARWYSAGATLERAEMLAQEDIAPLAAEATEEREQLIAHYWGILLRRLQAVLEDANEQE